MDDSLEKSVFSRDDHARGRPRFPGERLFRFWGLQPAVFKSRPLEKAIRSLVPAGRRLSDYRHHGLDVRLTRSNVRTGRLEISEHLGARDQHRIGVERGRRVTGDPLVVPAVMASAAFPVAYRPVEVDRIYPPSDNEELYVRAAERASTKQLLTKIFGPRTKQEYLWLMYTLDAIAGENPGLLRVGRETELHEHLRDVFIGDHSGWMRVSAHMLNTLIETRHWPQLPVPGVSGYAEQLAPPPASEPHESAVETVHEAFVVLLSPRTRKRYLAAAEAEVIGGPALGVRALRLQAERRLAEDVKMAERIDRLLAERGLLQTRVETAALAGRESGETAPRMGGGGGDEGAREGIETWIDIFAREGGPMPGGGMPGKDEGLQELVRLHVTRIHPSWDLPWVLALDDRLGFHAEQAREFQARGCRDTVGALYEHYRRDREKEVTPPPHGEEAARFVGLRSWGSPAPRGWICAAEDCTLRETCDKIAAREIVPPQTTASPMSPSTAN
jgi:hypothetical protein